MKQMTLLEQLEEFYYITYEDWQLWDESEQGPKTLGIVKSF
jgi:hypothetical protein